MYKDVISSILTFWKRVPKKSFSLWQTKSESCGKSLDVTETLKAHGGFFNPITNQVDKNKDSRAVVTVKGVAGEYEVSSRKDAKSNKDTLINIYGVGHKKDASKLIFHQHYFGSYQKNANSPVIQGYLHTVKSTTDPQTVTVQGYMKFFYLNIKTVGEKQIWVYFGKNDKNGNNGGIVFDQNNVAKSGQLQVSYQNADQKTDQGPHKKYNIEALTEIERDKLKKLNLFDIAPA